MKFFSQEKITHKMCGLFDGSDYNDNHISKRY